MEGYYGESKHLIICDPEEKYAQALADYLMQKKELAFQVRVCSSMTYLLETEENTRIDILFISEEYPAKERRLAHAGRVFVLTGNGHGDVEEGEHALYKYQSGEKILEEMLRVCQDLYRSEDIFRNVGKKGQVKIIGIFSPVHRTGKTTYALKLGEELAVSENVLYMNMEVYGGVGGHFDREGLTLSDLLYYAGQERGNLGLFLATMVCHKGNLDYVLPMGMSEEIKEVRTSEWLELIQKILEQSIYETVILDLDEAVSGIYKILEICTEIYMPTTGDACAEAKIRQFEQEAELLGKEDILRKIVRKEGCV